MIAFFDWFDRAPHGDTILVVVAMMLSRLHGRVRPTC